MSRVITFTVLHLPDAKLLVRGPDFFVGDPLHHYMETGMLNGTKARAEGRFGDVDPGTQPPDAAVEPVAAEG